MRAEGGYDSAARSSNEEVERLLGIFEGTTDHCGGKV